MPPRRLAAPALLLVLATAMLAGGAAAQTPAAPEMVSLVAGCTNISLTWPAGTDVTVVAAAIAPAGALRAIWKLDPVAQIYRGYSPDAPQASDLTTVEPLDAVFICTAEPATLTRPPLGAPTAAAVPGPAAAPPPAPVPAFTTQILTAPQMVARGAMAIVAVLTSPFALCEITYTPPPGAPIVTTGLDPRPADRTGTVLWYWYIPLLTPVGQASVAVSCPTGTVVVTFRVV
jgi:hypothetical protein